tara:strand:- start:65 stop:778 length:714 start_codon:yes stop_codon:yes gene_type:complete
MPNSEHIAVISGASSGIGEAIAKEFASNGITVCLGARSTDKLEKIVDEIKSKGGKAYSFYLDFLDDKSIQNFIIEVNVLGEVSTVINNSGFGKFDKIESAQISDWDEMMSVNLRSAFLLSQTFIPTMKKNKSGNLVFINSVAGRHGYPFSAGYVASKFGMRGLAESLRNELREDNIKVTSVYPGAVDSFFWDNVNADFPRDEMMTSKEIAETVLFAIQKQGIGALEDIVIRRTKGDF